MTSPEDLPPEPAEIPAAVVRGVAQQAPRPGDFRARFPHEQPAMARHLDRALAASSEVAREFAERLAAGLWAIYERALDAESLQVRDRDIEAVEIAARRLVGSLRARHPAEPFDPEWLVELPREPQPHVVGFLVGALRASRLRLTGDEVFETAVALLALAGALEQASRQRRRSAVGTELHDNGGLTGGTRSSSE